MSWLSYTAAVLSGHVHKQVPRIRILEKKHIYMTMQINLIDVMEVENQLFSAGKPRNRFGFHNGPFNLQEKERHREFG